MRNLLRADIFRMYKGKWLPLCALFMAAVSVAFVMIQRLAMEYTVSIDRVLFLPMSLYGVAAAALVSMFVGEDFSGGVIRNKIISGAARRDVYRSGMLAGGLGCLTVYLLTVSITIGLGVCLFPITITAGKIVGYVALGMCTCMAYASIFHMISMLLGNRNTGVVACMMLAF